MPKTNNIDITYKTLKEVRTLLDEDASLEIVINDCYGGFSLSRNACEALGLKYPQDKYEYAYTGRGDPKLIEVVKRLGDPASGVAARLKIIKVDCDDVLRGYLVDYDGNESVQYGYREDGTPLIDMI